jgi:hypothetical protein
MTLSHQEIKPEQLDALEAQSRAAFDAEISRLKELSTIKPALKEVLNQSVHPQSLCGCGCEQVIGGNFCFESCGCGCGLHSEAIHISASSATIGPRGQQGTSVRFDGQVTGTGTNLNLSNIYMAGSIPDSENLIGVPLTLMLSINDGAIKLTLSEYGRVLGVVVSLPSSSLNGQFLGSGTGTFQRA